MAYTFTELPFGTAGATLSMVSGNMTWEKIGPNDYAIAYLARLNGGRYLMVQHVQFDANGIPTFDKPYMLGACLADETYLSAYPLNLGLTKLSTGNLILTHSFAMVLGNGSTEYMTRAVAYHVRYDDTLRFWNNGAIYTTPANTPPVGYYGSGAYAAAILCLPVADGVGVLINNGTASAMGNLFSTQINVTDSGTIAVSPTTLNSIAPGNGNQVPGGFHMATCYKKYDQNGNYFGVLSVVSGTSAGGQSAQHVYARPYAVTDSSGNTTYNVQFTAGFANTMTRRIGDHLPYQPDGQDQTNYQTIRPSGVGGINGIPDKVFVPTGGAISYANTASPANWRQEAALRPVSESMWLDDQHFMLITASLSAEIPSKMVSSTYGLETNLSAVMGNIGIEVGKYDVVANQLTQSPGQEMKTNLNMDGRYNGNPMSILNSSVVLLFGCMADASAGTPAASAYKPGILTISL